MKPDPEVQARPEIGRNCNQGLGIRQNIDIPVVNGLVNPRTGGLSAFENRDRIPAHYRTTPFRIFTIECRGLSPNLEERCTNAAKSHFVIEPTTQTSFAEFEREIEETLTSWVLI